MAGAKGVLVIHDVDALSPAGQKSLLRWMDGQGAGARVIALAGRSVYHLVEQGRFGADLYYRLCIVQVPA
jgi:DNA-binding NtrC family response regulator